jgi:lipopolysaccharide export system protein LptA
MVIYADSIEAILGKEGKGIERVIASGNVKVQQGLRVASCEKAVFDNPEQKIILMGDPKVWEGENMVSGEEILFDISKNRLEVKGGESRRSKVMVHPDKGFEKLK